MSGRQAAARPHHGEEIERLILCHQIIPMCKRPISEVSLLHCSPFLVQTRLQVATLLVSPYASLSQVVTHQAFQTNPRIRVKLEWGAKAWRVVAPPSSLLVSWNFGVRSIPLGLAWLECNDVGRKVFDRAWI